MEVAQYIDVLTQAPLAVLLMILVYMTNKNSNQVANRLIDTIDSLTKVIKQQERKD